MPLFQKIPPVADQTNEPGEACVRSPSIENFLAVRAEYRTFEDLCRQQRQMSRTHAYELLKPAQVVGNLNSIKAICTDCWMPP